MFTYTKLTKVPFLILLTLLLSQNNFAQYQLVQSFAETNKGGDNDFGLPVSNAGDVNNDGIDEVILGDNHNREKGTAYFFSVNETTLIVNTTDDLDDGTCDVTHCSLREAINASNNDPGQNEIYFNIPGTGPYTIQPLSPLPDITDTVIIDGFTQPGYDGSPVIEIDGTNAGAYATGIGLKISAGNSTVRGLVINRFAGVGILLDINGGNKIEGNYIGTDVSGTSSLANGQGIYVNSPNNSIGGYSNGARNIISGNTFKGVWIDGIQSTSNSVIANFIGTDVSGEHGLGNGEYGIGIDWGADNTVAGNTISDNGWPGPTGSWPGVGITGNTSSGNRIIGNLIGTSASGTIALGNSEQGVFIADSPNNIIGGTYSGARNIISGNGGAGVDINGSSATGNLVQGNFIGTDVTGTTGLGNGTQGIDIYLGASNNIIGGNIDAARNIISANFLRGIRFQDNSHNNLVQGNYIGTDYTGLSALPNYRTGVYILNSTYNIIGGTEAGAGNVISGNLRTGIAMGSGANNNTVQGNFIGTDDTGEGALGNGTGGILIIQDAVDNLIGGNEEGTGNIIAYNTGEGIVFYNYPFPERNRLSRNSIFSNEGLGIDLSINTSFPWGDGVTANDPGDLDAGPNELMNYPFITGAFINHGELEVEGNIDTPNPENVIIEIFANDVSDASGHGEGETFLGTTVPDVNGTFIAKLPVVPAGTFITATATDQLNNTSEFALNIEVIKQGETVQESYDIYVYDIKKDKLEQVTSLGSSGEYNPSWSQNGKKIAHDYWDGTLHYIYITDVKSKISRRLEGAEWGNDAAWSPNGNKIAFHRYGNSYVITEAGGDAELLIENGINPSWSQNSKYIVYLRPDDNTIRTLNVNDLTEQHVVTTVVNPTSFGPHPFWSHDGKWIVYGDDGSLWKSRVTNCGESLAPPELILAAGEYTHFSPKLSNKGNAVVFSSYKNSLGYDDADIYTCTFDGLNVIKLTGLEGTGDYDPEFSKNGKLVAFSGYTKLLLPKNNLPFEQNNIIPTVVFLQQNYPNPFNPSTVIRYELQKAAHVRLEVYNPLGQLVSLLVNNQMDSGFHELEFNAENLPSGIYIYRLIAGEFIISKKMLLVK